MPVPYPELEDDDDEDEDSIESEREAQAELAAVAAQREAEKSVLDLTRNIQRKKKRKWLHCNLLAGKRQAPSRRRLILIRMSDATSACPCGSGKKFKKCHGA